VPPGAPRNTNFFSATVNITSIDVDNLNLTPLPLLDIQGLVRSEAPLTESLKYLRVTLQPERGSGGSPSMKLNDDSTFTLSEVMPDTYRISVSGVPPGSYVKSIDYDRQDASNGLLTVFQGGGTLTIHLAPGTGRLNASVQDESGGSVYQAAIIIAAVSDVGAQSERVRIHYTDENGRAEVLNLPAGDYKTFVIEDNDEDTRVAQSPEFLAEVGVKAVAVTVHANSPASVDLKMLTADEISRIKQKLL
jgi:hypothetical protein